MRLSMGLMVCLVFLATYTVVSEPNDESGTTASLAERIEAACTRPGYSATDWTVGDEWEPVPEGFVKVTCTHKTTYSTYKTVVSR